MSDTAKITIIRNKKRTDFYGSDMGQNILACAQEILEGGDPERWCDDEEGYPDCEIEINYDKDVIRFKWCLLFQEAEWDPFQFLRRLDTEMLCKGCGKKIEATLKAFHSLPTQQQKKYFEEGELGDKHALEVVVLEIEDFLKCAGSSAKGTSKDPSLPATGSVRRFECRGGDFSKFWNTEVRGSELITRFGRIGTTGQEKVKTFPDAATAAKARAKLIKEKIGKGYEEV